MKKTIKKIQEFKEKGKKITALTAYDYSTAKYFDNAGVDVILIGDSLAQVVLGYKNTTSVGVDEMKIFTSAVARGVEDAFVVTDMPFLSYQSSLENAVKNAGKFIKAGANGVKIEGASNYIVNTIKHLVQSGIPTMGHLGFTPQFINTIGGNFIAGKSLEATLEILEQALLLEQAGVFAIVLEMVPSECAAFISKNLKVPTIGIGAGAGCDGQILVSDDILGRYDNFTPKFARKYANLKEAILTAAKNYCADVENGTFPSEEEGFNLKEEELIKLENYIKNQRAKSCAK